MKLKREMKLKDGRMFDKGDKVEVTFKEGSRCCYLTFPDRGNDTMSTKVINLCSYVTGFTKPSMEELEEWSDGACESMTGDMVEPDGYGPDGAPSWLIALGMI